MRLNPDAVPITRRGLALLGAATLGAACAGPATPEQEAVRPSPPGTRPVHLVSFGWHTEVVLPVRAEDPLGRLLAPWFPAPGLMGFGFGERGFFTHPAPGSGDLLRALAPGEAALVAEPIARLPAEGERMVSLPVTRETMDRLTLAIAGAFARDAAGGPVALPEATVRPGGRFFLAARPYSLGYTCNTWTLHMLAEAGVPVRWEGVVLASTAMAEARRARRRMVAA